MGLAKRALKTKPIKDLIKKSIKQFGRANKKEKETKNPTPPKVYQNESVVQGKSKVNSSSKKGSSSSGGGGGTVYKTGKFTQTESTLIGKMVDDFIKSENIDPAELCPTFRFFFLNHHLSFISIGVVILVCECVCL